MIDASKIKVGDEVTVRMRVDAIGIDGHDREFCCRYDDSESPIFISSRHHAALIVSYTPAPRKFKPGDSVTLCSGLLTFEFVAERKGCAALWNNDHGWQYHMVKDLRHADESE